MLGEALCELDAGVGGALVPGVLLGATQALLALLVGDQCRVGGGRGLLVAGITVSAVLVFGRRLAVLVTFEERFRQQVVGLRRIRISGEGLQVIAVPAGRFLVVGNASGFLRTGMKIGGHVLEVGLQLLHHARVALT